MKNHSIIFIGLDTHKVFSEVVYGQYVRGGELNHLGKINSTKQGVIKLARQLTSKYLGATLHFVCEAGPCG